MDARLSVYRRLAVRRVLILNNPPARAGSDIDGGPCTMRVHRSNNVPSQLRTLVVQEVVGTLQGDFRRFWAVFSILGDFKVVTLPEHT
jgi:hypothetical protein